nr:hypothetical protein [uncultured Draconibacterium sp.]
MKKTGTNGQDQYLAPMQGFFVRANAATGTVTFNTNARAYRK